MDDMHDISECMATDEINHGNTLLTGPSDMVACCVIALS